MLGCRQKHPLIWFSISMKVLVLCTKIYAHKHQPTLEGQYLVNASLLGLEQGKNQNIEQHGNVEKEDMLAMVASLKGNYDPSVTENKLEDSREKLLKCDWHVKLDQSNRYRLDWTVDYAENEIIFALNINHTSSKFRQGSDIFALGFSENGELVSSDFCIIWYDLSHKLHLQDAQTDSRNRLQLIDSTRSQCKLLSFPSKKHPKVSEEGVDPVQADSEWDYGGSYEQLKPGERSQPIEIIFKRPLDVCHPADGLTHYKIDNGTTHLVWFTIRGPLLSIDGLNLTELASSSARTNHLGGDGELDDPRAESKFEFGMKRVQLIANYAKEPKSSLATSLDIRMEKFGIPAKETTYWCKLFKLPHKFETRRYHLTKYEAVIEKGNEHIVHHMELFNCANLDASQEQGLHDLYDGSGWSGDCGASDRPQATKPCRRVILAWAMGAHPLVYPEQVGQSIGGHGYSPYVVLEVHYNNVESSAGLIDNSGLRFHYTSKLRPYDAGVLEVGLEYTDKISIPPRLIAPISGHCVSECTRVSMVGSSTGKSNGNKHDSHMGHSRNGDLEGGIYIFAGQMHTHLTGVASWTEIVREGRLVAELQRDNHYSPHFQEIRLLPEPVHVAPGDALIHYCLYDTRKRINVTLGGYATTDEMCVTYLHYYPRIDLEVCKSSVDTSALEAYFAYLAKEESQNTSEKLWGTNNNFMGSASKSVSENYHSIRWTPRRSKELIQFYANAPLSVQCNRSNGDRWPGHWNGVTPTRLWSDMAGPNREPFESHLPEGDQLIAYRGHGHGDRHAQCKTDGSRGVSRAPRARN